MKILLQALVLVSLISFTAPAEATLRCGHWCQKIKRVINNFHNNVSTPKSGAPELNASSAPVAGFLLTGLVLAGYERRRRIKLEKNV